LMFKLFKFKQLIPEFLISLLYFILLLMIAILIKDELISIISLLTILLLVSFIKHSPIKLFFILARDGVKRFMESREK
jgi:cell division protein FtsW (lipid II flippase)